MFLPADEKNGEILPDSSVVEANNAHGTKTGAHWGKTDDGIEVGSERVDGQRDRPFVLSSYSTKQNLFICGGCSRE